MTIATVTTANIAQTTSTPCVRTTRRSSHRTFWCAAGATDSAEELRRRSGTGPGAGSIEVSLQPPSEHALEPFRRRDQRVDVNACLDTLAVEQVHEILGRDVPGRARRVRATAETAAGRVQQRRAAVE